MANICADYAIWLGQIRRYNNSPSMHQELPLLSLLTFNRSDRKVHYKHCRSSSNWLALKRPLMHDPQNVHHAHTLHSGQRETRFPFQILLLFSHLEAVAKQWAGGQQWCFSPWNFCWLTWKRDEAMEKRENGERRKERQGKIGKMKEEGNL